MTYILIFNIVLLVVGIAILQILLWRIKTISTIKLDSMNGYYIGFIGLLVTASVVGNTIQIYLCNNKISDIWKSIIYTLLGWMAFVIVVVYREALRIPFSNILGYLVYSTTIENLVNCINSELACKDPENCPKDIERTIFEICTLLRSGRLFDVSLLYLWPQFKSSSEVSAGNHLDGTPIISTDEANHESSFRIINQELGTCVSNLFMVCYNRDLLGEFVLFILTGILCCFVCEYVISTIKCTK